MMLIYEQSNIKKIVGDNYPYLFKTKRVSRKTQINIKRK